MANNNGVSVGVGGKKMNLGLSENGHDIQRSSKATIGKGRLSVQGETLSQAQRDEQGLNSDISDSQTYTKVEETGGLNMNITIPTSVDTIKEGIKDIKQNLDDIKGLAEVGKAGTNTVKAGTNLGKAVADTVTGRSSDGLVSEYRGRIRNQELGLQLALDHDEGQVITKMANSPEEMAQAEQALEQIVDTAVAASGVEGGVDIVIYNNPDDNTMGSHKNGKIYLNMAYQDGSTETLATVLGDEMSHYVDYKKKRDYSEKRQEISTGYGDDAGEQMRGYVVAETTDAQTFQDSLKDFDFSKTNQEVANTEGMETRKYKVEVDAQIPYEKVDNPIDITGKYFHGDNRKNFEEGTSRMKQTFIVETDPNKSKNPLLQQNDHQATTILYDSKGKVYKSKQASSEYSSNVIRTKENGGDNVQIDVTGHGQNPLVPFAPAIDYEYQININPGTGDRTEPQIKIKGEHDRFPAHSVKISDMENGDVYKVHDFIPNSPNDVVKLVPLFPNKKVSETTR